MVQFNAIEMVIDMVLYRRYAIKVTGAKLKDSFICYFIILQPLQVNMNIHNFLYT